MCVGATPVRENRVAEGALAEGEELETNFLLRISLGYADAVSLAEQKGCRGIFLMPHSRRSGELPMAVLPHDSSSFAPDTAAILAQAVDETCRAMRIPATDGHGREIVAARVVDLARGGVIDPVTLCERVLRESRQTI